MILEFIWYYNVQWQIGHLYTPPPQSQKAQEPFWKSREKNSQSQRSGRTDMKPCRLRITTAVVNTMTKATGGEKGLVGLHILNSIERDQSRNSNSVIWSQELKLWSVFICLSIWFLREKNVLDVWERGSIWE